MLGNACGVFENLPGSLVSGVHPKQYTSPWRCVGPCFLCRSMLAARSRRAGRSRDQGRARLPRARLPRPCNFCCNCGFSFCCSLFFFLPQSTIQSPPSLTDTWGQKLTLLEGESNKITTFLADEYSKIEDEFLEKMYNAINNTDQVFQSHEFVLSLESIVTGLREMEAKLKNTQDRWGGFVEYFQQLLGGFVQMTVVLERKAREMANTVGKAEVEWDRMGLVEDAEFLTAVSSSAASSSAASGGRSGGRSPVESSDGSTRSPVDGLSSSASESRAVSKDRLTDVSKEVPMSDTDNGAAGLPFNAGGTGTVSLALTDYSSAARSSSATSLGGTSGGGSGVYPPGNNTSKPQFDLFEQDEADNEEDLSKPPPKKKYFSKENSTLSKVLCCCFRGTGVAKSLLETLDDCVHAVQVEKHKIKVLELEDRKVEKSEKEFWDGNGPIRIFPSGFPHIIFADQLQLHIRYMHTMFTYKVYSRFPNNTGQHSVTAR